MGKVVKLFLAFVFVFIIAQNCFAQDYKVLVLPDNIQFESTNYYIYPDTSVMFASDTINSIKNYGKIQTVSMNEIRDALRKNQKLAILTKKALQEFKYNYNVPFVDFKAIAKYFSTDKVLVITSQTDTQNYFLKRTFWDLINLPGCAVVAPSYKLNTYVALVDVQKEEVLWQSTFHKQIYSAENRIIASNFAPATEQLEKIKFYSQYFLSPKIAQTVQYKIMPPSIILNADAIKDQTSQTETFKVEQVEEIPPTTKPTLRPQSRLKNDGVMINDI